ncbi:hypothetical protein DPSP01_014408 [Paraphaeosphaeria sporulosa]
MALSTLRDPTVILTDYTNYTPWLKQLKTRCQFLKVWSIIDPALTDEPRQKPAMPVPPLIGNYQPNAVYANANPNNAPTLPSHLSPAGAKAYKDDSDYYKGQLDIYKMMDRAYQEEKTDLDKVVTFLQSTISAHLQNNCCIPGETIKQWINNLTITVGVDYQDEYRQARARYQEALKPMRTPGTWATWLSEYDHAATEAETHRVPELQRLDSVKEDFMKAVVHVAPMWVTTFQQYGSKDAAVSRKHTMKLFRDHMILQHPIKGKQKGAFAATGSSLAEGGEITQATDRDASLVDEAASFKSRGRPRKQRSVGQSTRTKRSTITDDEPAAAGGLKCPACEQRHSLQDCFYAFPEKQPEWFKPRPGMVALMKFRLENDPELQESLRMAKRPRSQTTRIKLSHTPTPTRITEANDE